MYIKNIINNNMSNEEYNSKCNKIPYRIDIIKKMKEYIMRINY